MITDSQKMNTMMNHKDKKHKETQSGSLGSNLDPKPGH